MELELSKDQIKERIKGIDKWLSDNGIFPYKKTAFNKQGNFIVSAFTYKGFPFPAFPFYQGVHAVIRDFLIEIDEEDAILETFVNTERFAIIRKNKDFTKTEKLFSVVIYDLKNGEMEARRPRWGANLFNIYQDAKEYCNSEEPE